MVCVIHNVNGIFTATYHAVPRIVTLNKLMSSNVFLFFIRNAKQQDVPEMMPRTIPYTGPIHPEITDAMMYPDSAPARKLDIVTVCDLLFVIMIDVVIHAAIPATAETNVTRIADVNMPSTRLPSSTPFT